MNSYIIIYVFVAFFTMEVVINLILDKLNETTIKKTPDVPVFFKDSILMPTYQRSQNYTLAKLSLNKYQLIYGAFVTIIILFSGILPIVNDWCARMFSGNILPGVIFLGILTVVGYLTQIPFSLYNTFKIENEYGFNNTNVSLYIKDMLKGWLLALIIGLPLLAALLWFLNSAGSYWWAWTWLALSVFQVFMLVVYPVAIAPLFNKFKNLSEGELKTELYALIQKLNFPAKGIYVMDGSKRSGHSNAYFTGFGKLRRIVLFDTLIDQLSVDELKAVLAHEVGHYKKNHIFKMLFINTLIMGMMLFLVAKFISYEPLYLSFGFTDSPQNLRHVGLFLLTTMFSTFSFLLGPLFNRFSRTHEFEADAYSKANISSPQYMINALVKLAEKNLSNLTPHPWYSAFHYSHPSVQERIAAIQSPDVQTVAIQKA